MEERFIWRWENTLILFLFRVKWRTKKIKSMGFKYQISWFLIGRWYNPITLMVFLASFVNDGPEEARRIMAPGKADFYMDDGWLPQDIDTDKFFLTIATSVGFLH